MTSGLEGLYGFGEVLPHGAPRLFDFGLGISDCGFFGELACKVSEEGEHAAPMELGTFLVDWRAIDMALLAEF